MNGVQKASPLKRKINWRDLVAVGGFDTAFLTIIFILLTVGLVMMFSASYVYAKYNKGDSYYYIKRQVLFAVVGIILMFVMSRVKFTVYKKLSTLFLGAAFVLLIWVLIDPYQIDGKEEFKRWLAIGSFTFQPSELAKSAIIMFCAAKMGEKRAQQLFEKRWWTILPYCAIIAAMVVLVFLESHVSGTIIFAILGVVMLYLGGMKRKWVIAGVVVVIIIAALFLMYPDKFVTLLARYAGNRITAWVEKDKYATTLRWQTNQSLYAIGSGGLFGLGLGNSKQKHLYMPEPQNDFVFSIVCEELGFIGAVIILALFAFFIWRGFVIAMNVESRFCSMLVMGIIIKVGLQVVMNIFVVTDTMPNTGIGLPFFSAGGTALVTLLIEMGMILSVSRYSRMTKK